MAVWAIADLHFSFGLAGKEMNVFGDHWDKHYEKIRAYWDAHVAEDDLVLIPGDISWAMHLEDAIPDLEWIDKRPGTKVMIRGNHDYWWHSASKVRKILPPSVHIVWNDAFNYKDLSIAGARLWDSSEYSFSEYIEMKERTQKKEPKTAEILEENEKIFQRELGRLELSLKALNPAAKHKIVMTHYPPISADLKSSTVSNMLEKAGVEVCVFGHLHSVKQNASLFGVKDTIRYALVACDWLDFTLLQIL